MALFQYDAAILSRFPQTVGGISYAREVRNQATPPALQAAFRDEQQRVIARLGDSALSSLESIAAWRSTFSAFGAAPTQYRSAPEALLRRLTKKGDIPSINALVDIGNLISIRYALPVAVFDLGAMQGGLRVCFATGDEQYTELGSGETKHPDAGEVIFVDEANVVYARRWCWKQSFQSAAKLDSSEIAIMTEAQHEGAEGAIEAALADLKALLGQYVGGDYEQAILSAQNPAFSPRQSA